MSGTVIVTKFSLASAQPASNALAQGEQAYSYISDKLWIGWDNGGVIDPIAIGGKFYTDQLKASSVDFGKTIASHAIITDSANKIDLINIDNITIDGNIITTTNTNGDLIVDPNGTGEFDIQANTNVVGNLTVSGTQNFASQTTLASVNVTDLTNNRVLLAGVAGEIEDSGNLTFDGIDLVLTGNQTITGNTTINMLLHVDGQSTLASLNVEDLTNDRVVIVGAGGEIEDSGNFTFNGTLLTVTGNTTTSGTVQIGGATNIDAQLTVDSLNVTDLTNDRMVFVGASGEIEDSADLTYNGSTLYLNGDQTITGSLDVGTSATIATLKVEDLTNNRVVIAGIGGEIEDSSNLTFNGTTLQVTGVLDVDNVRIDGNTISAINTDGGLTLTPAGAGLVRVDTNTAFIVASGSEASRPSALVIGDGAIRYNTSDNRFEGSVSGSWTGLGGVVDIDQDTYIIAEESSDDDTLRFYTAGNQELYINDNGLYVTAQITTPTANITTANTTTANIGTINVTTQMQVDADANFTQGIDVTNGDVDINDNLNVTGNTIIGGNLTVNGSTTTVESTVVTLNDPVVKVGDGSVAGGDANDRGISLDYGDGVAVQTGFFGMDMETKRFTFKPEVDTTDENYIAPWGDAQFSNLYLRGTLEAGATGNLVITDNLITTTTGDLTLTPAGGDTVITGNAQVTTDLVVNGDVTFDNDVPVTSGGTGMSSFSGDSIMITNAVGDAISFITPPSTNPEDYVIKFNSAGVPVASNVIDGGTF